MLQASATLTEKASDNLIHAITFTVIIPAHNEAAVIGRCLESILGNAPSPANFEIIVVANGCSDQTADIARRFGEPVRVIESNVPSKSRAINLGWSAGQHSTILVVDADVLTSYRALAATAQALAKPGIMAASPKLYVDVGRASAWVRAYYRVWLSLPYVTDNLIGGGVYGLSEDAQRSIGTLPEIIADDLFVRTRFASDQRYTVTHDLHGQKIETVMLPPHNVLDLIGIEARRLRGKIEVNRHHPAQETKNINGTAALRASWRSGAALRDIIAYVMVKLAARILNASNGLRNASVWTRDESTRSG